MIPRRRSCCPRITTDLTALLAGAAAGKLVSEPSFTSDAAVTVVCASEGYPTDPRGGDVVEGLDAARAVNGARLYFAGVESGPDGTLVTAGGRVVAVTALGPDDRRGTDDGVQGGRRAVVAGDRHPSRHRRRSVVTTTVSR